MIRTTDSRQRLWGLGILLLVVSFPMFVHGGTATYEYDSKGRLILESYGAANEISYAYDANDNRVEVVNRQYRIAVAAQGTGAGTVTSADTLINGVDDFSEYYTEGTQVTLTAVPDPGSVFMGWSGGGCSGTGDCVITVSTDPAEVTALFDRQYTVQMNLVNNGYCAGTVISDPPGIDCQEDCEEAFFEGTQIELTLTLTDDCLVERFYPQGWNSGSEYAFTVHNPEQTHATVEVVKDLTIDLVISPPKQRLYLQETGPGSGTIQASPESLPCSYCPYLSYYKGTEVTLEAVADKGSVFTGWSGEGCSGTDPECRLFLDDDTTVSARFDSLGKSITVERVGNGTVVSGSGDIDCGTDCTESYDENTTLTLTASPAPGAAFYGWDGAGCSGTGTCVVNVNDDLSVTALFRPDTYSLHVETSGQGSGTVTSDDGRIDCGGDCDENYVQETRVTLTAEPDPGSQFAGWWGGNCEGTGPCTVDLTHARTVIARFTPLRWTLTVAPLGTGTGTVVSDGSEISCGSLCSAEFDENARVILTAEPGPGSVFTGWFGGGCSGDDPCVVTMERALTVRPLFAPHGGDLFVDGSGGDDSNNGSSWDNAKQSIQAAVDQADGATQYTVHIKQGTYCESLTIPSGVHLKGGYPSGSKGTSLENRDPATCVTALSQSPMTFEGTTNMGIHGLTFTGESVEGVAMAGACLDGFQFHENRIFGRSDQMIYLSELSNGSFVDNQWTDNSDLWGIGVMITGNAQFLQFSKNILDGQSQSPWGVVEIDGVCGEIWILDNTFTGLGEESGVVFYDQAAHVTLQGNRFEQITGENGGIRFSGSDGTWIRNNTFENMSHGGILFSSAGWWGGGQTRNSVISGNTFRNIQDYWNSGIVFQDSADTIEITDNYFIDLSNGSGMVFLGPADRIYMADNILDYLRGTESGISFFENVSGVTVFWNILAHFSDACESDDGALVRSGILFYGEQIVDVTVSENIVNDFTTAFQGYDPDDWRRNFTYNNGIHVGGMDPDYYQSTIKGLTLRSNKVSDFDGLSGDGISVGGGATSSPMTGAAVHGNMVTQIQTRNNTGGLVVDKYAFSLSLANNLVRESPSGIRLSHGAKARVVNNTLRNNNTGMTIAAADVRVQNNIIADSVHSGLKITDQSSGTVIRYNDIYNNGVNYSGVFDLTGTEGNISEDPKLYSPARLMPGSPCIDAADSDQAPVQDRENRLRYDDPATGNTGAGSIPYTDMGAYEYETAQNPRYTVVLSVTGNGKGRVESWPDGIRCGPDCQALFDENTQVTLTAIPEYGSAFDGWSGDGCSGTGPCTLTQSSSVTARFIFIDLIADALADSGERLTWARSSDTAFEKEDGVVGSTALSDGGSAWLETEVQGPVSVSFQWRVSSELNHDFFMFSVDGEPYAGISGQVGWNQRSFAVPAGTHTLRWQYVKDGQGSDGEDRAWLDDVRFCQGAYLIDPESAYFDFSGGSGSIRVTGSGECWFATSDVPWITLTGKSDSNGEGVVEYTVAPGTSRSGTIQVAGKIFGVVQQSAFDSTFNDPDGILFYNGGRFLDDTGSAMAVQPDAKIVVAGKREDQTTGDISTLVVRYNPDGTLDESFGVNGAFVFEGPVSGYDWAEDAAIQADGKILITGRYKDDETDAIEMLLIRLTPAGRLDGTFGTGGIVLFDYTGALNSQDMGNAVVVKADGKIIVAGQTRYFDTSPHGIMQDDLLMVGFFADGSLDPGFGTNGEAVYDSPELRNDRASGLALKPDGKIIVAGSSVRDSTKFHLAVFQYHPDGTLDTGFGDNGVFLYRHPGHRHDYGKKAALDAFGRILVVGTGSKVEDDDILLVRVLPNGTLDETFGTDGVVCHDGDAGKDDTGSNLLIQPDGKIVVAAIVNNGVNDDLAVLRFDEQGKMDPGFMANGVFPYNGPANRDESTPDLAMETDCSLLLTGTTDQGGEAVKDIFAMKIHSGTPCTPRADSDGDADVDGTDLKRFFRSYQLYQGTAIPGGVFVQADVNEDGEVDAVDLEIFAGFFGRVR